MSKETTTIPTEEYINLCSYRRIVEDKEPVFQRIVIKEDGVTRCEEMQVFAPEEYQQRVEEWRSVYNNDGALDVDGLRELYALREKSRRLEFQYIRKCNECSKMYGNLCEASEECAILEKECENLKSKMNDYYFWKYCSITLFLILCVLFYIMVKSNL